MACQPEVMVHPGRTGTISSCPTNSSTRTIQAYSRHIQVFLASHPPAGLPESVSIGRDDIDFQRKLINIRGGKGHKDRIVPLPEILSTKLEEYIRIFKPGHYLFEGQKGGQYSTSSVQSILKSAIRKAGIKKRASVHSLRHSFATHALEEGTDIRLIQEILGHSSLKTTEIYTHISNASILKVKRPIDKLSL